MSPAMQHTGAVKPTDTSGIASSRVRIDCDRLQVLDGGLCLQVGRHRCTATPNSQMLSLLMEHLLTAMQARSMMGYKLSVLVFLQQRSCCGSPMTRQPVQDLFRKLIHG